MSNKRQQIVDALELRLKSVSGIGGRVYAWHKVSVKPEMLPCILINDTQAGSTVLAYPKRDHHLTVEITGLVSSKTTASQARELINAIYGAIGTDDTFSGLAHKTDLDTHDMDLAVEGDQIGGIKITATVHYRTGLWEI